MLSSREIRESLAQSFVVGIPGPQATTADLALVAEHGLGGVILFARNLDTESPAQAWELCMSLRQAAHTAGRPPLFTMVDQEGGSVARLKSPFTDGPDFRDLGEAGPDELFAHGARLGAELTAAGFNWDLAPVLDVHGLADGVMAKRSLGANPGRVAELGASFILGLESTGCLACAKHFPGLGRTTADTHKERPTVELDRDELEEMELIPFRRAAGLPVAGIMVCHAVFSALDPETPASLSPKVVQDLLRAGLGYPGLILTDDLEMGAVAARMEPDQAAVAAYLAGCDLLLICHRPEYALRALDELCRLAIEGEIPEERILASLGRIRARKLPLNPLPDDLFRLTALLS